MTDYALLKLSSAEEIVAEVVSKPEEGANRWVLKAPRMLIMQQTPNGMGIAILPYSAGAPDGEHEIGGQHVVSTCEVPDKLEKAYVENTTNIQIVAG